MNMFLVLFLMAHALAHDLWIEKKDNSYILYYGHTKPKEGEERFLAYNPEKVIKFECYDEGGRLKEARVERSYPSKLYGQCAVVYGLFSSGYWTKTPEGTKNLPRDRVGNPIESWVSYESVKRVERWPEDSSKPLTQDLEVVLEGRPSELSVGKKFTLRVYYGGKPLKDALVSYKGKTVGATDSEGRVNLRIREEGLQVISASFRERADGTKADYIIRTTTLLFELKL
jgi:nickel transport protein